ncbi:MAG: hypothetical protein KC503_38545 [Myxococcales bacterium]|nr:hypothetical protein [Myxococcales bacterium]
MNEANANVTVPAAVQQNLQQLFAELQGALGNQLIALELYGPYAKGEVQEGSGGKHVVHVVIVVNDINLNVLDRLAPPVRKAITGFNLSPMVLTPNDLHRSTDVFPIKFLDIKRHHILVGGQDVISQMPIQRQHIRLRCEQELKNVMLRLRSFYIQGSDNPEAIKQTLVGTVRTFFDSVATLVELKSGKKPVKKGAVAKVAAETMGFDGNAMQNLIRLQRGDINPSLPELKQLYSQMMMVVDTAARVADEMED